MQPARSRGEGFFPDGGEPRHRAPSVAVSNVSPNGPSRRPNPAWVWPRLALVAVCACALGAPLTAGADSAAQTVLSPGLLEAARTQPDSTFELIVQGEMDSSAIAAEIRGIATTETVLEHRFETVPAVAATLTGSQIVSLAEGADPLVITRDSAVVAVDAPAQEVPPPPATGEPTVTGDPEPGVELTATPSSATSYRWQRCGAGLREAAALADSPRGYWPLRDREGDVILEEPAPGAAPTGFSLEGWVELESAANDQLLISRWSPSVEMTDFPVGGSRDIALYLDNDGRYALLGGLQGSVGPAVGDREHVAVTWDGSILRLYRNGAQIGSAPLAVDVGGQSRLRIASSVDSLAVYDRALSPSEVRGHYAGCTDVAGAGGAGYRPTAEDLGLALRVVVEGKASPLTSPVTARPPVMTSPPSILGTTEEGQTLHAANGSWGGTLPLEFSYQWQRCDAHGATCIDIDGATESSYTLDGSDVGATLRLEVAARGLGGRDFALAEAAPSVTAIPRPQPRFKQHWPYVAGIASLLSSLEGHELAPATIAIVDSGIDSGRADFGGRVVERVTLNSRSANQPGDGNGHGTAVASVAAGERLGYTGAAPNAKLVDVDVLDDEGAANVSDVIKAADWIYDNRERLNIRIANFSLHGTSVASLASDPLDKAVERLWLSGIVVVTAAGNYAVDGAESAVPFAPANDPFVLTVGATDTRGSYTVRDDIAAPWSAWGYTRDGFAKPEMAAPGRYIAAAVSPSAKLARDKPDRITEPGYMQLSGTSLAAPVVAGTAATLLAVHPEWTPDQIKGALMLSAEPVPNAPQRALGVGAVNAEKAAAIVDPPNPNLALNGFLVPDPAGGGTQVFDADRWTAAAEADPAWASVAWGSVAWGSAAWSSVAWGSVAWGSVAWGSVAWGSVAWGSVAWGSHSDDDVRHEGGYWVRRN